MQLSRYLVESWHPNGSRFNAFFNFTKRDGQKITKEAGRATVWKLKQFNAATSEPKLIYRYAHDVHSCKRTHDLSDYLIPLQVKMGQPQPLLIYICLFKHTLQFLQQINVKNVHPVSSTGIRTHDLLDMSLLP